MDINAKIARINYENSKSNLQRLKEHIEKASHYTTRTLFDITKLSKAEQDFLGSWLVSEGFKWQYDSAKFGPGFYFDITW